MPRLRRPARAPHLCARHSIQRQWLVCDRLCPQRQRRLQAHRIETCRTRPQRIGIEIRVKTRRAGIQCAIQKRRYQAGENQLDP